MNKILSTIIRDIKEVFRISPKIRYVVRVDDSVVCYTTNMMNALECFINQKKFAKLLKTNHFKSHISLLEIHIHPITRAETVHYVMSVSI